MKRKLFLLSAIILFVSACNINNQLSSSSSSLFSEVEITSDDETTSEINEESESKDVNSSSDEETSEDGPIDGPIINI